MSDINWRDTSKELPTNKEELVVIKIQNNSFTYLDTGRYDPEYNSWSHATEGAIWGVEGKVIAWASDLT